MVREASVSSSWGDEFTSHTQEADVMQCVCTHGSLGACAPWVGGCMCRSARFIFKGMGLSCASSCLCVYHVCALEEIIEADTCRMRASEEAPLADDHLPSVYTHLDAVSQCL